jgi:SAM-dependent methyltransferase
MDRRPMRPTWPVRAARALPIRPVRVAEPELLDQPDHDPTWLAGNLADLRRVNRWLGGVRLTIAGLEYLCGDLRPGSPFSVVDLATGSADIPAAVADWAARRGLRARILATDINAAILRLAARECAGPVEFARADARHLPFADDSFDVATCSLVLHHLDREEAVAMLREMGRAARRGIIVNDLVRNWLGYAGAWLLSRALTANPMTRHDAPLSARRAYTRREMMVLAARAGLCPVACTGYLGYRVALIARRQP